MLGFHKRAKRLPNAYRLRKWAVNARWRPVKVRSENQPELRVREFVRRPDSLPMRIRPVVGTEMADRYQPADEGGGLCFHVKTSMTLGAIVEIAIPVENRVYKYYGKVVWVHPVNLGSPLEGYEIGLCLGAKATTFRERIAEQICYIEAYRQRVHESEGRNISSCRAAREWMSRYKAWYKVCFQPI